ncbi:helix-turn-helix domain-containing protein [Nocardioidaceae bacterium]|nr:helix-turn-helix domain-containing protein [Nocardioidaceae bacterium]
MQVSGPVLHAHVVEALRGSLPRVGDDVVRAIPDQVPAYASALSGEMGATIREAVRQALDGFLRLASQETGEGAQLAVPMTPVREAAYALGRGEARSGRTADALLSAYRVGARVSWHELSATAVTAGVGTLELARFAELVFAYIDDLSAASVAGHTDELAATGMLRERQLRRLGALLGRGADEDALRDAAQTAGWEPPDTLTAVLVGSAHVRTVLAQQDDRTLRLDGDEPGTTCLLVPDVGGAGGRRALLAGLGGSRATVGPERPWQRAVDSRTRAERVRTLVGVPGAGVHDAEDHLVELVLTADAEALADLTTRTLRPLREETAGSRERLVATMRAWWEHGGRRAEVAEALHVHPQTVRYRMGRVRELFGDAWEDPAVVRALGVVLAAPVPADVDATVS